MVDLKVPGPLDTVRRLCGVFSPAQDSLLQRQQDDYALPSASLASVLIETPQLQATGHGLNLSELWSAYL